jgi:hypothetical protein
MSQDSKHVLTSKTNNIGLAVIGLAAFAIYQDYSVGGIEAVEQTDVGTLLAGLSVIINRLTDKAARKLYWKK